MAGRRTLRRTVLGGVLAWGATFGGLRAVVLQPEHCGNASTSALQHAAEATVGWFGANQHDDGTWLYRYDRATDTDLGGYNIVRHAGVTMSLEQAASAGFAEAAPVADRGLDWALDHLYEGPGWVGLADDDTSVPVGATALLAAAMAERRQRTGERDDDEVLIGLGRFMVAMVNERGQVLGTWDAESAAPVPASWNQYSTGEVFWALALLHRQFPALGFDAPSRRIGRYLATERDGVEGWWPDVADHWAAYGFAAMTAWPEGVELSPDELAYVRRQAGFQSLQIRYESQRTNSWFSHLTRGRQTLGAGMGTIGEALDQWTIVAGAIPPLADLRGPLTTRSRCAAGVIVGRQAGSGAVPDGVDPDRVAGAWFQFDVSQMDDQQHSLSAVLGALATNGDDARPSAIDS